MNLRKLKNQAGFTLVELIVVIAIMAILAGVAVPVYSGYIEKANKAADLQLLGAVNSAFGAACAEDGIFEIADGEAQIVISSKKIDLTSARAKGTDVSEAFTRYFAGNETAEFKVITALTYKNGAFQDDATLEFTYTDANGNKITINVPQSTIDAINNSTYGEIGADTLLGQVNTVSQMALGSIMNGGTFADVVYDENFAYITALAESLGTDPETLYASFNDDKEAMDKFMANSLILSAASGTAGMDADTAIGKLKNDPDTYIDQIKDNLKNAATAQDALADAALIYGVYTSYVYATDPENAADKLSTVNGAAGLYDALDAMQSADFEDYMANGGAEDLNAYLEAMKVVDSAASDPAAKKDILEKGFTDEQLSSLLQGVMGK